MSRWFRHYAGMCRDEKLVRVALRSKQTIERVVWIYSAILESASEIDNGGQFEVDVPEIAYFLRADEADVQGVIDALEAMGRLAEGAVAKWGDRQFQSDRSAERQRLYREKKRSRDGEVLSEPGSEMGAQTVTPPSCDGRVTSLSRHGDSPETETETETEAEKKEVEGRVSAPPAPPKKSKPKSEGKGSRIADDWQPSSEDLAYGARKGLHPPEIARSAERFKLWALSASGPNSIKRNWSMAFHNWLLSDAEKLGRSESVPVQAAPQFETTDDWFASLRARRSAAGAN